MAPEVGGQPCEPRQVAISIDTQFTRPALPFGADVGGAGRDRAKAASCTGFEPGKLAVVQPAVGFALFVRHRRDDEPIAEGVAVGERVRGKEGKRHRVLGIGVRN